MKNLTTTTVPATDSTPVSLLQSHNGSSNNTSPTADSQPSEVTTLGDWFPDYVIGGVTIGFVVLSLVVAILLWRKRPGRSFDVENSPEKVDGIYDEIAEALNHELKKKLKSTEKSKKKKTNGPHHNNNNKPAGIELVAIDAAPDIITAHDNESIYETLDGRRAARAKADHVTCPHQSNSGEDRRAGGGVRDAGNTTYDHLSRFTKAGPRQPHPPTSPEKRLTDPEVVTRPKHPSITRAVRSAEHPTHSGSREEAAAGFTRACGGAGEVFTPTGRRESSDSSRSSLTELARQSVCGGKRLVCQLTMVGVVENGRPVPMPVSTATTSNAYFVLEPSTDSRGEVREREGEGVSHHPFSHKPKFRIRNETGGGGDPGAEAESEKPAASGYFILEPLEQEEDLASFADALPSNKPASPGRGVRELDCDTTHNADARAGFSPAARCSLHGQRSVSSFPGWSEERGGGDGGARPKTFRTTRFHSCPNDADRSSTSPTLPPRHISYRRSFSSPHSSLHRPPHREEPSTQKKMDADALKARIQQEMLALGFATDSDDPSNDGTGETTPDDDAAEDALAFASVRQPTNEYYILEPESGAADDEERGDPVVFQLPAKPSFNNSPVSPLPSPSTEAPGPRCTDTEDSGGVKLKYQQRQQPPGLPPRLPQRNKGHVRSKSETPVLSASYHGVGGEHRGEKEEEEGPVIVSLKKSRVGDRDRLGADLAMDGQPSEPFRPRFKSESRGLFRFKRK